LYLVQRRAKRSSDGCERRLSSTSIGQAPGGRISRIGDHGVRVALYKAANVILTRAVRGSDLKSWALGVARRAGMKKAKGALARKLAVVLHRMLADGTPFMARQGAGTRAVAVAV
jgi:transposase